MTSQSNPAERTAGRPAPLESQGRLLDDGAVERGVKGKAGLVASPWFWAPPGQNGLSGIFYSTSQRRLLVKPRLKKSGAESRNEVAMELCRPGRCLTYRNLDVSS